VELIGLPAGTILTRKRKRATMNRKPSTTNRNATTKNRNATNAQTI